MRTFLNVSPFGDVVVLGRTIKAGDPLTVPDDETAAGLASQPLNWLEVDADGNPVTPPEVQLPPAEPPVLPEQTGTPGSGPLPELPESSYAPEATPIPAPDADPAPAVEDASATDPKSKK